MFNGSEHFLQVEACDPGEDVLHSWICEMGLSTCWIKCYTSLLNAQKNKLNIIECFNYMHPENTSQTLKLLFDQ